MVRSIAILASSGPRVGSGHISRQICLAEEALQRGWDVSLIGSFPEGQVPSKLCEQITVLKVDSEASVADHLRAIEFLQSDRRIDCLLVDNYSLLEPLASDSIQRKLPPQIHFEDGIENENSARIIVNSGVSPSSHRDFVERLHDRSDHSILGPNAAIIGRKIWQIRAIREDSEAEIQIGNRGMINLGNSDTTDLLEILLGNLLRSPSLLGSFWDVIASSISLELLPKHPSLSFATSAGLGDASNFYSSLAICRFAIGGAGVSSFERAFLGIPSINFPLAENQSGIATILSQAGVAITGEVSTTWFDDNEQDLVDFLDPERLQSASRIGKSLVDGRGVFRILDMSEGI